MITNLSTIITNNNVAGFSGISACRRKRKIDAINARNNNIDGSGLSVLVDSSYLTLTLCHLHKLWHMVVYNIVLH